MFFKGAYTSPASDSAATILWRHKLRSDEYYFWHILQEADWHIRGIEYHYASLLNHYLAFKEKVATMEPAQNDVLVVHSPNYPGILYEFYALVNLARITLERLQNILRPLFIKTAFELPKSVRKLVGTATNCPVYKELGNDPTYSYLIDVRNCLVHYRSFAASRGIICFKEGTVNPLESAMPDFPYVPTMAMAFFGRGKDLGPGINIFLPDQIYATGEEGKLASFSYEQKLDIGAMSLAFTELSCGAVIYALRELAEDETPRFTYTPPPKHPRNSSSSPGGRQQSRGGT